MQSTNEKKGGGSTGRQFPEKHVSPSKWVQEILTIKFQNSSVRSPVMNGTRGGEDPKRMYNTVAVIKGFVPAARQSGKSRVKESADIGRRPDQYGAERKNKKVTTDGCRRRKFSIEKF